MFHRFLLPTFLFFCFNVFAQEGSLSIGGNISTYEGEIAYSIGLPFYTAISENNITVEQGHQHAYAVEIDKAGKPIVHYNYPQIAPNPAVDHVILTTNDLQLTAGNYQIIDLKGRVISSGLIKDNETKIPLKNMETAVYYLSILNEDEKVAGFKIIKVKE